METFLRNTPAVTALVSGLTLLLSVVHEWMYFLFIGPEYLSVMALTDYLTSALRWLPSSMLSVGAVIILEMFTRRMERGLSEREIVEGSPDPAATEKYRRLPWVITMGLILLLGPVTFMLMPFDSGMMLFASFCVLWMLFFLWFISSERIRENIHFSHRRILLFVPIILIFVAGKGYGSAIADLRESAGSYDIDLRKGKVESVQLLRSFDVGVFIRIPNESALEVVPWSEIVSINKTHEIISHQSRACLWFGVLCLPEKPEGTERSDNAIQG